MGADGVLQPGVDDPGADPGPPTLLRDLVYGIPAPQVHDHGAVVRDRFPVERRSAAPGYERDLVAARPPDQRNDVRDVDRRDDRERTPREVRTVVPGPGQRARVDRDGPPDAPVE